MSTPKGKTLTDGRWLEPAPASNELEPAAVDSVTAGAERKPASRAEAEEASSWIEPTAQQASSGHVDSRSPFGVFDDDDEDVSASLPLELDGADPTAESSVGPRPRPGGAADRGAQRSPSSRSGHGASSRKRRVRLMGRPRGPSPSKAGEVARLVLAALLAAGLAAAVPKAAPLRLASLPGELGVLAHLPFLVGAAVLFVAALWLLAHGARWSYLSLLLAPLGLTAVAACGCITAGALAVPGLVGSTPRMIAVIATPWAAMVAAAGLALYAFGRANHLLRQQGVRWLGVGFVLSALTASAAVTWLGRQPLIGVGDVAEMQLVAAEPRMERLIRHYALATAGARALQVRRAVISPPTPRRGAAVAAALQRAEPPRQPAPR